MLVNCDSGFVETQVVSVGATTDCEQHMGADHCRSTFLAIDADGDLVLLFAELYALRVEANLKSFVFENLLYRIRDIGIFVFDHARRHLDDRDLASKASEHLSELEADVAAADDDQVRRKEIHFHHRGIVEIGDIVNAGQIRRDRAPTDIKKYLIG